MGDPQVTMCFNTKYRAFLTWMIWGISMTSLFQPAQRFNLSKSLNLKILFSQNADVKILMASSMGSRKFLGRCHHLRGHLPRSCCGPGRLEKMAYWQLARDFQGKPWGESSWKIPNLVISYGHGKWPFIMDLPIEHVYFPQLC